MNPFQLAFKVFSKLYYATIVIKNYDTCFFVIVYSKDEILK